ncbi:MAG: hypothetical protein Q7R51_00175 [bacterium]|nr:hypothetical protein [bacterium]
MSLRSELRILPSLVTTAVSIGLGVGLMTVDTTDDKKLGNFPIYASPEGRRLVVEELYRVQSNLFPLESLGKKGPSDLDRISLARESLRIIIDEQLADKPDIQKKLDEAGDKIESISQFSPPEVTNRFIWPIVEIERVKEQVAFLENGPEAKMFEAEKEKNHKKALWSFARIAGLSWLGFYGLFSIINLIKSVKKTTKTS